MATLPRALGKMNTSIERIFRFYPDGFYREVTLHFLNFLRDDGSLHSKKLDFEELGDFWRIAREGERSSYGERDFKFPHLPAPVRMIWSHRA